MDSIAAFLARLLTPENGTLTLLQSLGALGVAYLGGVLSSLTPCVYPMIPITVSVVGGVGNGKRERSWHEVALRSISYVSGMAVVYAALGVVAGLTGRVFGTFTNTSGWYLGLGAVLTLASLMMLEVIKFDPAAMLNTWNARRAHRRPSVAVIAHHEREVGLVGAFALGASSGFIAAPCTTPALTAILAYIAQTQSVGLGMGLMLAFSAGLGTLLLLIAAFAGALRVLPRSGQWMNTIKVASGLILLFFAQYLIYRAGQL
jgi:cytochrome c-type biogenesis protein